MFGEFIRTEGARQSCDPRITGTGGGDTITTQNELVKFARERWPTQYPADIRKSTGPCGREAMARLWAAYLSWSETVVTEKTAKK
jgi:hypothetical protein